jgi:hypothetical protein
MRVKTSHSVPGREPYWLAGRLVFEGLTPDQEVTIKFPVVRTRERHTLGGQTYRCSFKGNTLVDISPRDDAIGYPIYERSDYMGDHAPTTHVRRCVSDKRVHW